MNPAFDKFKKIVTSPFTFKLFLLQKLPAAFFAGLRIQEFSPNTCVVKVRYNWFTKNPFKSMYWAVQGMAAELATGALVMHQIQKSGYNISMLVANNKGNFSKKATGIITFVCNDGALVANATNAAIACGDGQLFWMKSIGRNENGEIVSEMDFEWSIRVKPKKG